MVSKASKLVGRRRDQAGHRGGLRTFKVALKDSRALVGECVQLRSLSYGITSRGLARTLLDASLRMSRAGTASSSVTALRRAAVRPGAPPQRREPPFRMPDEVGSSVLV
jgi:hypothetical protein